MLVLVDLDNLRHGITQDQWDIPLGREVLAAGAPVYTVGGDPRRGQATVAFAANSDTLRRCSRAGLCSLAAWLAATLSGQDPWPGAVNIELALCLRGPNIADAALVELCRGAPVGPDRFERVFLVTADWDLKNRIKSRMAGKPIRWKLPSGLEGIEIEVSAERRASRATPTVPPRAPEGGVGVMAADDDGLAAWVAGQPAQGDWSGELRTLVEHLARWPDRLTQVGLTRARQGCPEWDGSVAGAGRLGAWLQAPDPRVPPPMKTCNPRDGVFWRLDEALPQRADEVRPAPVEGAVIVREQRDDGAVVQGLLATVLPWEVVRAALSGDDRSVPLCRGVRSACLDDRLLLRRLTEGQPVGQVVTVEAREKGSRLCCRPARDGVSRGWWYIHHGGRHCHRLAVDISPLGIGPIPSGYRLAVRMVRHRDELVLVSSCVTDSPVMVEAPADPGRVALVRDARGNRHLLLARRSLERGQRVQVRRIQEDPDAGQGLMRLPLLSEARS